MEFNFKSNLNVEYKGFPLGKLQGVPEIKFELKNFAVERINRNCDFGISENSDFILKFEVEKISPQLQCVMETMILDGREKKMLFSHRGPLKFSDGGKTLTAQGALWRNADDFFREETDKRYCFEFNFPGSNNLLYFFKRWRLF